MSWYTGECALGDGEVTVGHNGASAEFGLVHYTCIERFQSTARVDSETGSITYDFSLLKNARAVESLNRQSRRHSMGDRT